MGLDPVVQAVQQKIGQEGQDARQHQPGDGALRPVAPGLQGAHAGQDGHGGVEQDELGGHQLAEIARREAAGHGPAELFGEGQPVVLGVPDHVGGEHRRRDHGRQPGPGRCKRAPAFPRQGQPQHRAGGQEQGRILRQAGQARRRPGDQPPRRGWPCAAARAMAHRASSQNRLAGVSGTARKAPAPMVRVAL